MTDIYSFSVVEWRVWNQGVSKTPLSPKPLGENPCLFQLLVYPVLVFLDFVALSPQSLPLWHIVFSSVCPVLFYLFQMSHCFCLMWTFVFGLGPNQIIQDKLEPLNILNHIFLPYNVIVTLLPYEIKFTGSVY